MENWLIQLIVKEAGRRFKPNQKVRYFTGYRKGTGKKMVMTPPFEKGEVLDYDSNQKRYKIRNSDGKEVYVHPRNLAHD